MWLLGLTLVSGASLLFLVQPLMGAFILPWFGGAPAVWTTCMLFFQTLLLGGYAYAHGVARRPLRQQALIHAALALAALAALPITPDPSWIPEDTRAPIARILGLLTVSVGLPYLVLSSTSTLMQAWAARLFPGSPYRLYAWSNAASLSALFAYPLLVEPRLGAKDQARAWGLAFAGFAALSLASAALAWRRGEGSTARSPEGTGHRARSGTVLSWIALAALPSALLLAVTEQITADVSVIPFFWILPLALYLLTFIIVFAQDHLPGPARTAVAAALGLASFLPGALLPGLPLLTQLGLGCGGLFLVALALHTELVRRRPPPAGLTGFYLAMALGGALGGAAVALAAPTLLPARLELPALLTLSALAFGRASRLLGPLALAGVTAVWALSPQGEVETRRRSFYGSLRVELQRPSGPDGPVIRHLVDGRVSHGFQSLARPREAMGYYGPGSGVRVAFDATDSPRKVGLIGLGTGTLAALGRAGDHFTFYELNPDVIEVARSHFSYLKDSPATVTVEDGDARVTLARASDLALDLLVLDAFSGDAVPAHLLTAEAFALWRRHLAPGGLLALHVSNHHLDLALLVHGQLTAAGWTSHWLRRRVGSPLGPYVSQWIIAGAPERMAALGLAAKPPPAIDEGREAPRWTDDHHPLWPLLK